ncbi:hypothetical protein [Marinobacter sp. M-5]|uniref:hypothetical protein n=1 Tax=Marinobacter sp. M-5 TaxID=3081089 RepID=UPI00293CD61B|nr:hypothetical protein [Marinobacter sp. M-5]MDV3504913.1 hypothetical protein [Marinobacter sp. M-5]
MLFTPGELESARIDGFFSLWGIALIVGGIGAVFFPVGAGMFVVPALRNGKAETLVQSGQLVQGGYQRVGQNTGR